MTWGVVFKYSRVTIVENTISNWTKLQGPSFWEMIAFFIGTSKFGSILLQWLLTYLNLTLDAENLFCLYKQKKWFLLWAAQAAETIEKTLYFIYSTISLLFYVLCLLSIVGRGFLTPILWRTPIYCLPTLFSPFPFTAVFVALFLWLNVSPCHIWCVILLNDVKDLTPTDKHTQGTLGPIDSGTHI